MAEPSVGSGVCPHFNVGCECGLACPPDPRYVADQGLLFKIPLLVEEVADIDPASDVEYIPPSSLLREEILETGTAWTVRPNRFTMPFWRTHEVINRPGEGNEQVRNHARWLARDAFNLPRTNRQQEPQLRDPARIATLKARYREHRKQRERELTFFNPNHSIFEDPLPLPPAVPSLHPLDLPTPSPLGSPSLSVSPSPLPSPSPHQPPAMAALPHPLPSSPPRHSPPIFPDESKEEREDQENKEGKGEKPEEETGERAEDTEEQTEEGVSDETEIVGFELDSATLVDQQRSNDAASEAEISSCFKCDRPDSWDNMIMCDGPHEEQWYHMKCVGIQGQPPKGEWLCPDCKLECNANKEVNESDVEASNYGSVPKRHLKRPEKAAESLNPRQDGTRRPTPRSRRARRQNSGKTRPMPMPIMAQSQPSGESSPTVHSSAVCPQDLDFTQTVTAPRQPEPIQHEAIVHNKKQDVKWTAHEKDLVRSLMEEVISEQQVNLTEKKWEVISDRLAARNGFVRSKTSIKNYWNREGRSQTGVDERRKPNPNKMVTSLQNAEQRKRAREDTARASNAATDEDYENQTSHHSSHSDEEEKKDRNDDEQDHNEDDEGGPPTKRRRRR